MSHDGWRGKGVGDAMLLLLVSEHRRRAVCRNHGGCAVAHVMEAADCKHGLTSAGLRMLWKPEDCKHGLTSAGLAPDQLRPRAGGPPQSTTLDFLT